ncbi:MAG TPA: c-type cytochrome [Chitinophagaceae bacterium]|nr:c-type cytochrome [Chitinophagaceae bacterium]
MKKLMMVAVICGMAVTAAFYSSCKSKDTKSTTNNEDSIKQVVARGEYLANHVAACIHCHSTRDFDKYSGPTVPGTEGGGGMEFSNKILDAIPGVIYAKNITPDPETGIGDWTDEEILKAITKGIRKNGDTLFPLMPYANFNTMAKEDLMSIIAYLRTLKPIKNKIPERQLMIPISVAYPARAVQAPVEANDRPAETDKVKYGEYLATICDCSTCHTPFVKGQPDFARMFGGGNTFHINDFVVTSANITPDSTTGLGTWTEEMFLSKFKQYRKPQSYTYNPGKQNTVMPTSDFAGMKDEDLKAIYAYLHSVKAVSNKIDKYPQ